MNESDFLNDSKNLLKKIVKQRDWLLAHNKSHVSSSFASLEIRNLEYAISKIKDAGSMKEYLVRKHQSLHILISSRNKKYQEKLNQLIDTAFSLQ
jgi:hypothetical protein